MFFEKVTAIGSGDTAWLCTARNDDEALELARRAALLDGPLPSGRQPQDFTLQFIDDRVFLAGCERLNDA